MQVRIKPYSQRNASPQAKRMELQGSEVTFWSQGHNADLNSNIQASSLRIQTVFNFISFQNLFQNEIFCYLVILLYW